MVVVMVLSVALWLSIPPVLSRVMARHGYDGTSYLVAGVLTKALAGLRPRLRRVGLARVLSKGGPRADERRADQGLREAASDFDHAELALLFGRPDVAIAEYAASGGYGFVLTARPDSMLSARLTEAGRVHCCGDEAHLFGPGRFPPVRRWSDDTEAPPSSATRTRSARTA